MGKSMDLGVSGGGGPGELAENGPRTGLSIETEIYRTPQENIRFRFSMGVASQKEPQKMDIV